MNFPDKLLVANRGEIALRIIRSAKLLGIRTVAIFPESERESGYVMLADEKVSLGEDDLNATYLNISRIIKIALSTGSSAIHPGYGFLSESPEFAMACRENQITFVGPEPGVLRLMGNKPDAKGLAESLGIPVVPGFRAKNPAELSGQEFNFPVLIKASFGGGGKGMKIVDNREELMYQANRSSRTALEYFGNGEIFIEELVQKARHVEVQIMGDTFGNVVHLYERECSVQRNHQKIVEEAPALFLSAELREKLLNAAVTIGKATGYTGAGTVEFLVDPAGNYYFMEMNPRIQVEHAVTEEVTGIDIVSEQLKIASGFPLSFRQEQVVVRGHAIEVRVYAENPVRDFRPSSQPVLSVNLPDSGSVRIEADLITGKVTKSNFDPLLLKLIAHGEERQEAIDRVRDSIKDLNLMGPETNTAYLEKILAHPLYHQNNLSVEFCKSHHRELISYEDHRSDPEFLPYLIGLALVDSYLGNYSSMVADPWDYAGYWRLTNPPIPIMVDDTTYKIILARRSSSTPTFQWNGVVTGFTTADRTDNCMEITINRVARKICYHRTEQGEILVVMGNIRHTIKYPGLLKNYPETGERSDAHSAVSSSEVISPLHGKILDICIKENQLIKKGDPLLVIGAMKTETHLLSHRDARVKKIAVKVGAQVTDRMPLIILED